MKARLLSSIAIACCIVYPWQSLAAGEEIKYPSPDGKMALRITDASIELIQKASGEVIVDLGTASRSQALVWSSDLKWVAYGSRGDKEGEPAAIHTCL